MDLWIMMWTYVCPSAKGQPKSFQSKFVLDFEWNITIQKFGNRTGKDKLIRNFQAREKEASILGNGLKQEFPWMIGTLRVNIITDK